MTMTRALTVAGIAVSCLALAGLIVLPIAAIFLRVGPAAMIDSLQSPVALDALRVSLRSTALALAGIVVIGTPAAYLLATRAFPGRALMITLVELPIVLPPAVAGLGLLVATTPNGPIGRALAAAGLDVALTPWAVVIALAFVGSPFYVRAAIAAFGAVEPGLMDTARTLGCGEVSAATRVALPIALPGLAAGATLAAGRALGEFGATIMFAGSIQGSTQTLPLAIYATFPTDLDAALAMGALLVATSAAILLTSHLAIHARDRRRRRTPRVLPAR